MKLCGMPPEVFLRKPQSPPPIHTLLNGTIYMQVAMAVSLSFVPNEILIRNDNIFLWWAADMTAVNIFASTPPGGTLDIG